MRITVKSDALQVLASTRAVFTSTKGNSPISRNARLTTEGNTLILRATNGAAPEGTFRLRSVCTLGLAAWTIP